ncbi:MAG TPA: molybdopterin-dependent oxidoreductase [Acidimicrobiales bacterium]|nr:molybdopterin-dependent oxidoreductase [Acidimicrobiales bacterium]
MTRSVGLPAPLSAIAMKVATTRDAALDAPTHDDRTAAILGITLGITFTASFVTGLYSHFLQHPPDWFVAPARPAGLYRVTQGIHVATGLASIPLLFAKLWAVFPRLFQWPLATGFAHAIERVMIVPLVCGSVFMLFSGASNIARWYPWRFFFPTAHYWVAYITYGALLAHIGAKLRATGAALSSRERTRIAPAGQPGELGRRGFLGAAAAASGFVTLTTVGQTFGPLRSLVLFAPRRTDIGVQGLPVNRAAIEAGVVDAATDSTFALRVSGAVRQPLTLSLKELEQRPRRQATLPIACVEGWSANATWQGISIIDLLDEAGIDSDRRLVVDVHSLESGGLYAQSTLDESQARDHDTLLALEINGQRLDLDHGYPCRLIGPGRAGVQQTKWVSELVVR